MASISYRSALQLRKSFICLRPFSTTQQKRKTSRSFRLIYVAIAGGAAYAGYQYIYREQQKNASEDSLEVLLYTRLPLNAASRAWGKLNNLDLPVWMRSPILRLYIRMFNCNLDEAANTNLNSYENLGQFFRRALKPDCRPVDKSHPVTCPSDGAVISCGMVTEDSLEQIKGVYYTISNFMGPQTFLQESGSSQSTAVDSKQTKYQDGLKYDKKNNIYQCVIYLAPGDYHRFHSPTDWRIAYRRYFAGPLLSVNPKIVQRIPGLFNLNERVLYFGQWQHGFFAMALVGATNVGSIKIYTDEQLVTNSPANQVGVTDKDFRKDFQTMTFSKGAPFGEFNLGSTIVLVFEAPESFAFDVKPGQKVQFGQALGH